MNKKIFLLTLFLFLFIPLINGQEFSNYTNPYNFTIPNQYGMYISNDELILATVILGNFNMTVTKIDVDGFTINSYYNVTTDCLNGCPVKGITKVGSNYYVLREDSMSAMIMERMTSSFLYSGISFNLTANGLPELSSGIAYNNDNNRFYLVESSGVGSPAIRHIYELSNSFSYINDYEVSIADQQLISPTATALSHISYNGNNYYVFTLGTPNGVLIYDSSFNLINYTIIDATYLFEEAQYFNDTWVTTDSNSLRIYNALSGQDDINEEINALNYDFFISPSLGTLSQSGDVNQTTVASAGTGQIIFSASNFDEIPNYILSQCNKDPVNVLYDEFNTPTPYDNDWNSGGDTPYYNDFINPQSLQRGLHLFNSTFQSQVRHNVTPIINSDSEFSYDVYVKDLYNLSGTNTSSSLNVDLQSSGLDLIIHLRYYYDYDNSRICIYTYESEIENINLTDKLILCTDAGSYTDTLNIDATPFMEKLYVEGFIDWNIKDFSLRLTDADNNKYYSDSLPFRFDDELNIHRINVYADSSDSYSFIDNVNINDIEEYGSYTFNGDSDPFSFICQYPTNGVYTSCLYGAKNTDVDTHNNNNCVGVTKVTSALTNATDFLGDDSFLDEIFNVDASSLSTGTKLFYVLISVMITFLFFTVVGVMLGIAPIMLISAVVIVVGELAFFTIIGFIPIWVVILMFIIATGIITFTIKRMFFGGNSDG